MKKSAFKPTPEQVNILRSLRENHPRKYAVLMSRICGFCLYDILEDVQTAAKRRKPTERYVSVDAAETDEAGELTLTVRETLYRTVPLSEVRLPSELLEQIGKNIENSTRPRKYQTELKCSSQWYFRDRNTT